MISSLIILILTVGTCNNEVAEILLQNYHRLIPSVPDNTDTIDKKQAQPPLPFYHLPLDLMPSFWLERMGIFNVQGIDPKDIELAEDSPLIDPLWNIPDDVEHQTKYPHCYEFYIYNFNIILCREMLFYACYLISSCVSLSYLTMLVFYLPTDSRKKIVLCINILLSQNMFFLLISETKPYTLPLFGKYLHYAMTLLGLSAIIMIIIKQILKHFTHSDKSNVTSAS